LPELFHINQNVRVTLPADVHIVIGLYRKDTQKNTASQADIAGAKTIVYKFLAILENNGRMVNGKN